MAEIYVVTGPMAAGKTTVASLLAQRFDRGVHLEGDVFRRSVVAGREEMAPEPSAEALAQLRLRYRLAAAAADAYFEAGFTVVLEDVVAGPLLPELVELILGRPLHVVVLLPSHETVLERAAARPSGAYGDWSIEELHAVFATETPRLGLWLDTSNQTPDEVVDAIIASAPAQLRVAGVDACPGGWAVVVWQPSGDIRLLRIAAFAEVLRLDVAAIGVDIPIGAPEMPPRAADVEARRYVGARASSVFPTPPRAVLDAPDYPTALARHRELAHKGMSKQAYYLCHRMLEVEPFALADDRVVEVHPEVSFRELAGRPLAHAKKTAEGREERRHLLARAGILVPPLPPRLPLVDALDAAVTAWTAARWARREAQPFPEGHSERIGAIWR
jgi:predicted RNase H-like nuclease/chloramphenicol 3-O-phosphotransferase